MKNENINNLKKMNVENAINESKQVNKYTNKQTQFFYSMSILVFPILLYGILGPLEIYAGNLQEFNFSLSDFIWYFTLIAILLLVVGTVVLTILPKKIASIFSVPIFAFGIISYIQNMFLNRKLIQQDGGVMNWEELRGYTNANLIFWIILFLLICSIPFFMKKHYEKVFQSVSLFLSAIQVVTMISFIVSAVSYTHINNHYILSGENQYKLASEKNIIVIILDHYANDEFEMMAESNPETLEVLKDFTYYNNADSHYNFTFPSLPHMLTGEDVVIDMSKDEWRNSIWQSENCLNFYETMHKEEYTCNLYSEQEAYISLGDLQNVAGKFDNVVNCEPRTDHWLIVRLLEKMTFYKFFPYIVKPYCEVAYYVFGETVVYDLADGSVMYDNGEFYRGLLDKGLSIDEEMINNYTVMHLYGHHTPYLVDENCNSVESNETSSERSKLGISVMIDEYLSQMKTLGVYEEATIIITSDHGDDRNRKEPQPIYFLKMPGEDHAEMQINSAPISHDDYLATILSLAGQEYNGYGTSIFDWNEGDRREREVWYPEYGFYVYSYSTNREELVNKMENGEYEFRTSETDWRR